MSVKVWERLRQLMIELDHEERVELDKEIEQSTDKPCDEGVDDLLDGEFILLVNKVKKKKKKKKMSIIA